MQGQVGHTAQLAESCGVRVRLVLWTSFEEFCLEWSAEAACPADELADEWARPARAEVALDRMQKRSAEKILCLVAGRKKARGHEGRGCSLKRKLAASAEKRDSCHRSSDLFHLGECCFSMGGTQAWNTLAVFVSAEMVWHLEQRRENCIFYKGVRESRRIAAGNPWTNCCSALANARII